MKKIDFDASFKGSLGDWEIYEHHLPVTADGSDDFDCVDIQGKAKDGRSLNIVLVPLDWDESEGEANSRLIVNAKKIAKALCEANEKLSQYASGLPMSPLKGTLNEMVERNYKLLIESL